MKLKRIGTIVTVALIIGAAGCCTRPPGPVTTSFRIAGERAFFVVENNSDRDLFVSGLSQGINYRRSMPANIEKQIEGEGPDTVDSLTPYRFVDKYKKPLVIPAKNTHEFCIQGYRRLRNGESANIYAVLEPLTLGIAGRLELSESNAVSSCRTMPENILSFPVNADGCREFIVVVQDWNYPIGFIDHDGKLTMITSGLNTLGQIDSILPSPESSRVLIESHGEGHQFLSIYDVAVLIKQHAGTEMVPAVKTLDPYPSAFSNMKWIDDNTLQFDSVSDFNHFDAEERRGKYSDDFDDYTVKTWKWKIAEDKFEEIRTQHGGYGKPASSPP